VIVWWRVGVMQYVITKAIGNTLLTPTLVVLTAEESTTVVLNPAFTFGIKGGSPNDPSERGKRSLDTLDEALCQLY